MSAQPSFTSGRTGSLSLHSCQQRNEKNLLNHCRDRSSLLGDLKKSFIWTPQKVKFFWYLFALLSAQLWDQQGLPTLTISTRGAQKSGTPPFAILISPLSVYCWDFHKHFKYYLKKNATVQPSYYRIALGILSILWNCIHGSIYLQIIPKPQDWVLHV